MGRGHFWMSYGYVWEIQVFGKEQEAIALYPSSNGLNGTIPESLYQLSKLKILAFDENIDLTGTIPQSISKLSNLLCYSISNTWITGTIPFAEISKLKELRFFSTSSFVRDLKVHSWSHQNVPPSITKLTNLFYLNFLHSNITGTLPIGIEKLTELR